MRKKFEEELELVNSDLIEMGAMCEKCIAMAISYLEEENGGLAKKIRETEEDIDEMEKTIESLCLKLFMREQPVAGDLRKVSAALKMISDMERIGDHAVDICEVGRYIDRDAVRSMKEIRNMGGASSLMVNNVVKAYVDKDLELATNVMKYDDVVDGFFDIIKKDIAEDISGSVETVEQGLDCLMIAKYLERIGDHAVNIAEWVRFSITGEH